MERETSSMRKLRKLSVFALFFVLFATVACSLFSSQLKNMALNLGTGGGLGYYFMPAAGTGENAYILRAQSGKAYELYEVNRLGRQSRQTLRQGLPEEYEVQNLYRSEQGVTLLSIYRREGAALVEYGLYAAAPGEKFEPLLRAPLEGITADQKRSSAGLVLAEDDGERLCLTVRQEGEYTQYGFAPGQGLQRLQTLSAPQTALLREQQRQRLEAAAALCEQAGFDPVRLTALTPTADGGALVVQEGSSFYRLFADGSMEDLSVGLYSQRWQSGLCLLAILAVLLFLSYGCYYLVGEANKLYFPLAVKHFILLALTGYLAVQMAVGFVVAPAIREHARRGVQNALEAQVRTVAGSAGADLTAIAQAFAQTGGAYEDVALFYLAPDQEGWTVTDSSVSGEEPLSPAELARLRRGQKDSYVVTAPFNGTRAYYACAPTAQGQLVVLRLAAQALEQQPQRQIQMVRYLSLAALGLILLLALTVLSGIARGVKRATRGVGLIAQGAAQVQVVQQSGDELEALAAAVNDLSAQGDQQRDTDASQSEAYLRFVPQRLVALLGVSDIKQVDKTTTASHEMAVMAVRFVIPRSTYQRGAQALFDDINEVFAYAARPVSSAGGAIYSFTYDGFDAVFEHGAKTAAGAAVAVRQALLELNAQRAARQLDAVQLWVAMDYGDALIGVVGDEDRVVPTVVSDCLNAAYRLAALAPALGAHILCTASVADAAGEYALRYIGKFHEGKRELRAYELYDGDTFEARQAKESARELFSLGVYAFYSGDFSQAKARFMEIARRPGEDGVARHYLYLADQYEKQPPEQIGLD